MFKTVLVAADDSETAVRAVSTAVELVKSLGGELHVTTVYSPTTFPVEGMAAGYGDMVTEATEAVLQQLRESIEKEGVEAKYHPASGPVAEVIVQLADHVGADLIVVGNRGMRGVRRVLGSVPNSVAHQANCSVLIVDTVSDK
jgi:nucleotide-binding universal stress UspA family protein